MKPTSLIQKDGIPIALVDWKDDKGVLVLVTRYRYQSIFDGKNPYRHPHTFNLPEFVDARALQRRIDSGEFDELIDAIATACGRVCDGRDHVAEVDGGAAEAVRELGRLLSEAAIIRRHHAVLHDPRDWFAWQPPEVYYDDTDEELRELANKLEEEAREHGVGFDNLIRYLEELREEDW